MFNHNGQSTSSRLLFTLERRRVRRAQRQSVSGGLILHQNQRFEFAIGAGAGNVV